MENKLIGVILTVVVGVILLGGLLAPVISNYQDPEKTVSNTGSYFALVDDEGVTHTIIIGAGNDAFTITTDGESAIVPNMATYNPGGYLSGVKVAANRNATSAILIDGTCWLTGYNAYGQQGDGTTTNATSFHDVTPDGKTVTDVIVTDNTTVMLCSDGTVWIAGDNQYGQQGSGDTTNVKSFTDRTPDGVTVDAIFAARYTTFILTDDGTLYSTGHNNYGQAGVSGTSDVTTFTNVTPSGVTVVDVAVSEETAWILTDAGTVYGCGRDNYGQQARGTGTGSVTTGFANRTPADQTVVAVACSNSTTWILCDDGTVWGTGYNNSGQQGSGDTTNVKSFTDRTPDGKTVTAIDASASTTALLCSDGTVWVTGDNQYGQQGNGGTTNVTTFTDRTPSGVTAASVYCNGYYTTAILTDDGKALMTGRGNYGQQGNGGTTNVTTFTDRTPNGKTVTEIIESTNTNVLLCSDGTMWFAGRDDYGQAGNGDTTNVTTFTRAGPTDAYSDTASTSLVIGSDAVLRLYTTGLLEIITTTETIELGVVTASNSLTVTVTGDELDYTDKDGNDGTVSDILAYISSTGDMVMCLKPYVVESSEVIIGGYAHNLSTTGGDVISIGYCASGEIGELDSATAVLNPVSENENTVSSTDVVVNLNDLPGNLKQVDTVLFTSTWSDDETSTATYTYFLAPTKIVCDNTEFIGNDNAAILGAVIIIAITMLLLLGVRMITRRD